MAGYDNYSMSNNAVAAYQTGEKPKSKWNKKDIINDLREQSEDLTVDIKSLEKLPISTLREIALVKSSWHHTSSHFNRTDFYMVDASRIEEEDLKIEIKEQTEKRVKSHYLEWSGTRNHPKATDHEEWGTIKGNWFYGDSGTKKSITGNGFKILEEGEK